MSTGPGSSDGDTAREEDLAGEGAYDDQTPKSEVPFPIAVRVLSPYVYRSMETIPMSRCIALPQLV